VCFHVVLNIKLKKLAKDIETQCWSIIAISDAEVIKEKTTPVKKGMDDNKIILHVCCHFSLYNNP